MKASILTLGAVVALAAGSQAQAHLLSGNSATSQAKAASSKSTLAVMTAAGIRYHAAANYKNEQRLIGSTFVTKSMGIAPDDRPVRGI
jgi:hypothetical protein